MKKTLSIGLLAFLLAGCEKPVQPGVGDPVAATTNSGPVTLQPGQEGGQIKTNLHTNVNQSANGPKTK